MITLNCFHSYVIIFIIFQQFNYSSFLSRLIETSPDYIIAALLEQNQV